MSLKKKLLCLILCTVIVSSLSITVWADTITQNGGTLNQSDSKPIIAYYSTADESIVYSVDITWGSLAFNYIAGNGEWDPATHSYNTASVGWKATIPGESDIVTITNHSNAKIKADLSVTGNSSYQDAVPQVVYTVANGSEMRGSSGSLTLESAVGTLKDNAPSNYLTIEMTGTIPADTDTTSGPVGVGTATITLTKAE